MKFSLSIIRSNLPKQINEAMKFSVETIVLIKFLRTKNSLKQTKITRDEGNLT